MLERVFEFFKKHESFIVTTHEGADADGLGAELLLDRILQNAGKTVHILNSEKIPDHFTFMDPENRIGLWEGGQYADLLEQSALLIVDTSDEYNIGGMKELIHKVRQTFVIDHHEPNQFSSLSGLLDSGASSTCEIAVEIAQAAGVLLDKNTARAAFAGISYDTGSFAYRKTTARTFKAALVLLETGITPYEVYRELNESASLESLLLRRQVLSSLEIHAGGRVAVLILRKKDLEATGAIFEDAESFINIPLRARAIAVSVLIKESLEGKIRCSLRSKGLVNVSKIAQHFGGGGHVSAAGFRSAFGIEETLKQVLEKIEPLLEKI